MLRHHINTAIALTLALAAAAPSGASARPFEPIPAPTTTQTHAPPASNPHSRDAANPAVRAIQAQGARVARELAARDARTGGEIVNPTPPLTVTVFQPNGFDWGDAAIGAAGGLALSLIGIGGAVGVSQYRSRRTRNTAVVSG